MEIGAVRQVTWSTALVTKICDRAARIGMLGFAHRAFGLKSRLALAGFETVEAPWPYGRTVQVLISSEACSPEEILANISPGMLVIVDGAPDTLEIESIIQRSGLQVGRDIFVCYSRAGDPLSIEGATQECAKLGALLYLQVAKSVIPSVRHRVNDVIDADPHSER